MTSKSIDFPDTNLNVELCFIRKTRQNKKTYYIFSRADLHKDVAKELTKWLKEKIGKHTGKNYPNYSPLEYGNIEHIDLSGLDVWPKYKKDAFDIAPKSDDPLSKIKTNLCGVIFYVKLKDSIIGMMRKITPGNLLSKKGRYTLFIDNSAFNSLKENKGIILDKDADLLFYFSNDKDEALILNKYNFNYLFDIFEQQQKDSQAILDLCKFTKGHECIDELKNSVETDRQIQKMLLNPIVKEHMHEVTFDVIKKLKTELPEELSYDIDEKNKKIIFPEAKRREAIKSFIKVLSHRITQTVDGKHLIDGNPERVLK